MNQRWVRKLLRRRFYVILLLFLQLLFITYLLFSRSMESTIISGILRIISFLVCLSIISKKEKGAYKITWIFIILVFPIFGGAFYLLFNFQSATKKLSDKIANVGIKGKSLYTLSGNAYEQACTDVPQHLSQIRHLQDFAGFPVYTESHAKYLAPGEVMFERFLEELKKAEKYIFLEFFIVQEGTMWNSILEILKEKAKNGVKVRLLYDDVGCFFLLPQNYPEQLKEFGIDCIVFNRFKPFLTTIQNNRDHRKIASIDGKVAFTGGINLADEYINAIDKHGHWQDCSVVIEGKAAWSFTLMFLQMWEVCSGVDEDYTQYYPWEKEQCLTATDGYVQPYADSPTDKENIGEHVYLQIINNAKQYVYIQTPYLIIDDSIISALCLAAKSGVDVRITTPFFGDKWAVHTTTRSYYRELIAAGVKIYEYSRGFIHSKTFVSDDNIATIGTTNLDFRSLYLHFECGVCLYQNSAVVQLKEDYMKTLEVCKPISEKDCKCNIFKRLLQDILRLFAPLM